MDERLTTLLERIRRLESKGEAAQAAYEELDALLDDIHDWWRGPSPIRCRAEVVTSMCRLPVDYHADPPRSPVELAYESGYLSLHSEITRDELVAQLRTDRRLVDSWFEFSEDQRGGPSGG